MPRFRVVTERGVFLRDAETAGQASQRSPGKTLSVAQILSGPLFSPSAAAVDRAIMAEVSQASQAVPKEPISDIEARPTAKSLLRHAKHFGPSGVAEVAEMYGIALDFDPEDFAEPIQQRRQKPKVKKPSLKRQAKDLLERGLEWKEIAYLLDLTPTRSSILRRELLGA